jgi:hypothetical protein
MSRRIAPLLYSRVRAQSTRDCRIQIDFARDKDVFDMEAIYQRPRDYDLEHEGDDQDVAFYVKLLDTWQPRRVMELASGSGRVTIPLARAAAVSGVQIVGLEREASMLEEACRKTCSPEPHGTLVSPGSYTATPHHRSLLFAVPSTHG